MIGTEHSEAFCPFTDGNTQRGSCISALYININLQQPMGGKKPVIDMKPQSIKLI
jgi:hypothetical protein